MVIVSTLFHRVDGFEEKNNSDEARELPDPKIENHFLQCLLEPLMYDPGEELVQRMLQKI